MKKNIFLMVGISSILALSGCNDKKGNENFQIIGEAEKSEIIEVEAFDSDGKVYMQSFKKAPTKIITNNQSSTELLLQLGLEEYVIGTGDLDNDVLPHLQEKYNSIPVLSEKGQIAKEVVIGAEPDLVVGRVKSFTDETYGDIKDLNDMGINVFTQLASRMDMEQSLENIILDVRNLGRIMRIEERANEFADGLEVRLNNILELVNKENNEEPIKVMFMVKYTGSEFGVYGANASLQNEVLKSVGAVNIVEKGGTLSIENLISLNPDVIVYVYANQNKSIDENAVSDLLNNELLVGVRAIDNKKIIGVEYTELMGYGFRTFDCIEKIANEIYNIK